MRGYQAKVNSKSKYIEPFFNFTELNYKLIIVFISCKSYILNANLSLLQMYVCRIIGQAKSETSHTVILISVNIPLDSI